MKDRFLNVKDASKMLSISVPHFYRMVAKGQLPKSYKITTGRKAWSENEIFEVIERIKEQSKCA